MNIEEIIAVMSNGISVEEFLELLKNEDDKTQQLIRNAVSLMVMKQVNRLVEREEIIKDIGDAVERNTRNIQILYWFISVVLFITIAGFLQQVTDLDTATNLLVSLLGTGISSISVYLFSKRGK